MSLLYTAEYRSAGEWHFIRVWDCGNVGYFLTRGLAEKAALKASDCGDIRINEEEA